ncbi:MAG TPA: DUF4405 domain-containing protein [Spirochaetota bacterium]|nr:DUF4405 domain-containing protein [Spirochaetota bacterium]
MNRKILNYWIDVGMAVSFLLVLVTGLLKYKRLLLWLADIGVYLPTYAITEIHKYAGAAIGLFVLVHLVLHFKWIAAVTRSMAGRKKEKNRVRFGK